MVSNELLDFDIRSNPIQMSHIEQVINTHILVQLLVVVLVVWKSIRIYTFLGLEMELVLFYPSSLASKFINVVIITWVVKSNWDLIVQYWGVQCTLFFINSFLTHWAMQRRRDCASTLFTD